MFLPLRVVAFSHLHCIDVGGGLLRAASNGHQGTSDYTFPHTATQQRINTATHQYINRETPQHTHDTVVTSRHPLPAPNADTPLRQFESGLEPARQDFPEVSPSQHQAYGHQPYPGHYQPYPPYQQQPYPPSSTTPKRNPSVVHSAYDGQTVSSPYSTHAQPAAAAAPPSALAPRTICGCSLLVLILSCIISLLSAAVIGLAATTGIEAQRASSAAASLAAYTASATATGTNAPSATSTAVLDDGCAANPARVNKTIYTSFARA